MAIVPLSPTPQWYQKVFFLDEQERGPSYTHTGSGAHTYWGTHSTYSSCATISTPTLC